MIDHTNLPVTDLAKARQFYDAVLSELGRAVIAEDGPAVGYGTDSWAFGIIGQDEAVQPLHLAFKATSRTQVDAFHNAAIAAGGICNGPPGDRPVYGASYYACFILDPDGHNIEAVFRG